MSTLSIRATRKELRILDEEVERRNATSKGSFVSRNDLAAEAVSALCKSLVNGGNAATKKSAAKE